MANIPIGPVRNSVRFTENERAAIIRRRRLAEAGEDMLAALQHLVRWHDQLKLADIARAQAAISKAQGH